MTAVSLVHSGDVTPSPGVPAGLIVRPTLGPDTGFDVLHQAVIECPAGRSHEVAVGEPEETLFVLEGTGSIEVGGAVHALEPEAGVYLPPGSRFTLSADGPGPLRLVAVRIPDPKPGPPSPPSVRRLADAELEPATTQREFRIVADPGTGLRSATHFVGYIPTERAPEHFHTYDEVIYVLDGEGEMHAGGFHGAVAPGDCIQLPARTVHCLENTGDVPMRIVAVFRPAGSPAAAFLPDGTPAYQSTTPEEERK